MRGLAAAVLTISFAHAAVEGVVTNGTSGKPQPGIAVSLLKLGAGMEPVANARTGPAGRFQFDVSLAAGTPHLLQAQYDGVTYNKMLPPGSPSTGIEAQVFEASREPLDAKVVQHMILIEPSGSEVSVNETVIYENSGRTTWLDPAGTLRFYLPPAAQGKVSVSATSQGGMPLNRQARKTTVPDTYTVDFAVKPGETRFDLAYTLPPTDVFEGKLLHGGGPVRVVAPRGVTLRGEGLESLGPEPRTQATVYDLKTDSFRIDIQGVGSLRAAQPEQPEDTGPGIEQKKPRIYQKLPWVLAMVLGMLALGFVLLYRSQSASSKR